MHSSAAFDSLRPFFRSPIPIHSLPHSSADESTTLHRRLHFCKLFMLVFMKDAFYMKMRFIVPFLHFLRSQNVPSVSNAFGHVTLRLFGSYQTDDILLLISEFFTFGRLFERERQSICKDKVSLWMDGFRIEFVSTLITFLND